MRERLLPVSLVGMILLGVPVAMRSTQLALAIVAVAMLVLVLGVLGLDRTSEWTMVAAFGLAPCVSFVIPGFRFFNISDAFFLVAIALGLPRLLTQRLWLPPAFVIGSMAFVTISALTSLQAMDPGASYYYAARVILMLIVIPALLVWWSPSSKLLVSLVIAYALGTAVSVLAGLAESGASRNLGLTGHPNVLGYTAVLTLSLVPFLWKTLAKPHRSWICATVFAIAFVGIMSSGSRAALVTALVLIVLVTAAERSIFVTLTVLASGVVAMFFLGQQTGAAVEGEDALSRLRGHGVQGSNRVRAQGVEQVWSSALEHPFLGTGFRFSDFVGHNAYVQIAAAAGFLGLAAFAVIFASMVTPLFRHNHAYSRLVYPVVVFLIAAPVSPQLTERYIGLLLGLSMVGVVAVHGARRDLRVAGPAPPDRHPPESAPSAASALRGRSA